MRRSRHFRDRSGVLLHAGDGIRDGLHLFRGPQQGGLGEPADRVNEGVVRRALILLPIFLEALRGVDPAKAARGQELLDQRALIERAIAAADGHPLGPYGLHEAAFRHSGELLGVIFKHVKMVAVPRCPLVGALGAYAGDRVQEAIQQRTVFFPPRRQFGLPSELRDEQGALEFGETQVGAVRSTDAIVLVAPRTVVLVRLGVGVEHRIVCRDGPPFPRCDVLGVLEAEATSVAD